MKNYRLGWDTPYLWLFLDIESDEEQAKRRQIEAAIGSEYTTLKTWKDLAMSKHGLVGGKVFKLAHLKTKFQPKI